MANTALRINGLLVLLLLLGGALAGCQQPAQEVSVTVAVDFGPGGKPALEKAVKVPAKSTVFDALREAFPVVTSAR